MFDWNRHETDNPVIPVVPGSWRETFTANPDLLEIGDTYFLYFRGQSGGHDRIGLMTIKKHLFDGKTWKEYPDNPIIDVGEPGSFDSQHILDPGSVLVDDTVFLYYRAVSQRGENSVGLATSKDGYNFEKFQNNPVVDGLGAPEVVYKDGRFHLFYGTSEPSGGIEISLAISDDGYHFSKYGVVLSPGVPGSWDERSITTPRIFYEDGTYYMIYAGDDMHVDYPKHFGLALSNDLHNWRKYEDNPIFSRGEPGAWDDGGIWFGTVHKHGDVYYMWYEGWGGGVTSMTAAYASGGRSQIGLATLSSPGFGTIR